MTPTALRVPRTRTRRAALGLALLAAGPLALAACSGSDTGDTSATASSATSAAGGVVPTASSEISGAASSASSAGQGAVSSAASAGQGAVSGAASEGQDAVNSASSAASSVISRASSAAAGAAGAVDTGAGAKADVTVTSCSVGQFGTVAANLTVHNSQSQAQSYAVTLSAKGADGRNVATLFGALPRVEPGQTQKMTAVGLGTNATGTLTCEVTNATRVRL